jgi:hypothetical protein
MNRKNLFISSLLFTALSMLLFASLAFATRTTTDTVPASNDLMKIFNLDEGDKFTGSIAITGGSGDDVDFYVTDPHGSRIVDLGRVSQGTSFDFTAQDSGAYTLHFDNSFSLFSSKVVTLSYDIENPILPNGDNFVLWIIAGAIIIGVVLIGIAVYVSIKSKKQAKQP